MSSAAGRRLAALGLLLWLELLWDIGRKQNRCESTAVAVANQPEAFSATKVRGAAIMVAAAAGGSKESGALECAKYGALNWGGERGGG